MKNLNMNSTNVLKYCMGPTDILNWGDALNPILYSSISKKVPICVNLDYTLQDYYLCIGSILKCADEHAIIWGSGFIEGTDTVITKPKEICAVRGPLTRCKLIDVGIECPKIYGDPALLYPMFYKPKIKQIYDLGIIKHYADQDIEIGIENLENVIVIDILSGVNDVINKACSCKNIVSSSLHGLIIADTYGIPSCWMKLSDRLTGGDFKFKDYMMSIKKNSDYLVCGNLDKILKSMKEPKTVNLEDLMEACPFKMS